MPEDYSVPGTICQSGSWPQLALLLQDGWGRGGEGIFDSPPASAITPGFTQELAWLVHAELPRPSRPAYLRRPSSQRSWLFQQFPVRRQRSKPADWLLRCSRRSRRAQHSVSQSCSFSKVHAKVQRRNPVQLTSRHFIRRRVSGGKAPPRPPL